MDTKSLLLDFSARTGVSGREGGAADLAEELLRPYGAVERTPLGSVLCRVWQTDHPAHLLLDAHMDEIGLIVTHIEEGGVLKVAACGGIDRRLTAAAPVTVHAAGGDLPAVIASTPPHLSEGGEKNQKIDELLVDTGYSKAEAEARIAPGDRITLRGEPRTLLNGQVCGKAMDDRAGCVSLLIALEALKDCAPTCNLSVQFSTLEETGHQGAKTAAHRVMPTHGIVVDVTFAHTPDAKKEQCGELGKGPMIGFAPLLSDAMSRRLVELAREADIPYQCEVMSRSTGTNADDIATTGAGAKTALISIPLKYMHSPIETVCVEDVEHTGKLIAACIRSLEGGDVQ